MEKKLSREEIRKAWDCVAKDMRSLEGINKSFEEAMDIIFIHDELERLESENARLRKALQHIAEHDEGIEFYFGDIAREALMGDITPDRGGD
jgi:hypothetical protein